VVVLRPELGLQALVAVGVDVVGQFGSGLLRLGVTSTVEHFEDRVVGDLHAENPFIRLGDKPSGEPNSEHDEPWGGAVPAATNPSSPQHFKRFCDMALTSCNGG